MPSNSTFTQLDSGYYHSCGIASDNKAYCWGQGSYGKLGESNSVMRSSPVDVWAGDIPPATTLTKFTPANNIAVLLAQMVKLIVGVKALMVSWVMTTLLNKARQ